MSWIPQARDEFEEHFFDCQDCALDVHSGQYLSNRVRLS